MSRLNTARKEEVDALRLTAIAHFGPKLLQDALLRLCHVCGQEALDRYEKAMIHSIEQSREPDADLDDVKELAIEYLYSCLREVKCSPDMKQPLENIDQRRARGRSEEKRTLEDQLQEGLENSFPASDPPSVVSTSIPGASKTLIGTDEVLRRRRQKDNRPQ